MAKHLVNTVSMFCLTLAVWKNIGASSRAGTHFSTNFHVFLCVCHLLIAWVWAWQMTYLICPNLEIHCKITQTAWLGSTAECPTTMKLILSRMAELFNHHNLNTAVLADPRHGTVHKVTAVVPLRARDQCQSLGCFWVIPGLVILCWNQRARKGAALEPDFHNKLKCSSHGKTNTH